MDDTKAALDIIGPLRAQIALCFGVANWTGDTLDSWQNDLCFGLQHALNLADELAAALAQGHQDAPQAAKVFAGDVPVVGYAENDSGTK